MLFFLKEEAGENELSLQAFKASTSPTELTDQSLDMPLGSQGSGHGVQRPSMHTQEHFLTEAFVQHLDSLALRRWSTSPSAPEGTEGCSNRTVIHLIATERVAVFCCLWGSGETTEGWRRWKLLTVLRSLGASMV